MGPNQYQAGPTAAPTRTPTVVSPPSRSDRYSKERRNLLPIDEEQLERLWAELKDSGEEFAHAHREINRCNERMVNGDQFIALNTRNDRFYVQNNAWPSDIPRLSLNYLQNIALTWVSLLTKSRPSAYAVPTGPNIQSQAAAEIATRLIEYLEQELDAAALISRAVYTGCVGGTGVIKVCYSEAVGSVWWESLSVADYIIDPFATSLEDAGWCATKKWISRDEAIRLFDAAGLSTNPSIKQYRDGANQKRLGVESWELWLKPSYRYPTGLWAHFVQDECVEAHRYHYVFPHAETGKTITPLPLVSFNARYQRGTPYGRTMLSDAVPMQQGFNETQSRLFKMMRKVSDVKLYMPKKHKDADLDDDSIILISDPTEAQMFGSLQPPQIPPILFDQREDFRKAIHDAFGISETTSGQPQPGSKSGRALQNESDLDSLKNADSVKSLQTLTIDLWDLTLKVIQRFYSKERVFSILDDDTKQSATVAFTGADIQGISVRLQPRSGHESTQAAKEADAEQRLQSGLISPALADEARGSLGSLLARQTSQSLIAQYLATGTVEITPQTVDPDIFIETIQAAKRDALLARNQNQALALEQLRMNYLTMLGQQNTPVSQVSSAGSPAAAATEAPQPLATSGDAQHQNAIARQNQGPQG